MNLVSSDRSGSAITLGRDNMKELSSGVVPLDSDVNARQRVAAQIAARREGLRLQCSGLWAKRLPGVADQRDMVHDGEDGGEPVHGAGCFELVSMRRCRSDRLRSRLPSRARGR